MKKETCFYWGKRKYTTCTFILKVFTLLFDQSVRSRNSFCFEALTSGHNSSVLSYGDTGDRDIFSEFVFGPCFNRPTTTGRRYQRRALPTAWCLSRGRTEEKPPLLTQGSWWARRTRPSPALTQRKSTEPWCIMWIFNVYLQRDSWDGQTRKLEPAADGFGAIRPYTQRTPSLCSHCTRPR